MAIRKDKIQIDVEINSKKNEPTYKELNAQAKKLTRQLSKLKEGTADYVKKSEELAKVNEQLKKTPPLYEDIKAKARQLERELKKLIPGTDDFIKKAEELQKVNSELLKIRKQTRGVDKQMNELRASSNRLTSIFRKLGPALAATAIIAGLKSMLTSFKALAAESLKLFNIQAKADAELKQRLISTNFAAKRSFEELKQQATELQGLTLFGDEEIQRSQSLLLTFTKVQTDVFDRSIPLIQDYATALGDATGESVDLKGATLQVGKALNDPIKGISALAEAGVQFDEVQKKQIQNFVETGRRAEAQKIILEELESQFGGTAQAAAAAGTGGLTQLSNKVGDIKENIGLLVNRGIKLLLPFFNRVVDWVGRVVQKVVDSQAEFAGFQAGVRQIVENIRLYLLRLVLAAQIAGKKLEKALTISPEKRQQLAKEIAALEELKEIAEKSGKSIGEAYAEGRAKAIREMEEKRRKEELEMMQKRAIAARQNALKEIAEQKRLEKERAERAAKERERLFKLRLAELKSFFEREQLIIEGQFIRKEITEKEYQLQTLASNVQFYNDQLAIFERFGKQQTEEALKVKNELDRIRQEQIDFRTIAPLPQNAEAQTTEDANKAINEEQVQQRLERELALLENKFARTLIAEQEFELLSLEAKEAAFERRLELLQEQGKAETTEYLNLQTALLNIQNDIEKKKVENTKRTEDLRKKIIEAGFRFARDILSFGIDLLSQDEKARKKHGAAIKTFEVARVAIDVRSEIQGIWKNANKNPTNALIPGWANVWAAIQTGLALGRAGLATSKILKQKFAGGGFTGPGAFADETGHRVAGQVHEYEWVAPRWMVESPIFGPEIQRLEKIRDRGYNEGGLATVDTTPRGEFLSDSNNFGRPTGSLDNDQLERIAVAVENFPRMLKAYILYEDILDKQEEEVYTEQNSSL